MYQIVKAGLLFLVLLSPVICKASDEVYYRALTHDAIPIEMASARCELSGDRIYKDVYNDYVDRFSPKGAGMTLGSAALAIFTIPRLANQEAQNAYDVFFERCMRAQGWVRDN
jgi:hypothetical protein